MMTNKARNDMGSRSIIITRDAWDSFECICLPDREVRESSLSSHTIGKTMISENSLPKSDSLVCNPRRLNLENSEIFNCINEPYEPVPSQGAIQFLGRRSSEELKAEAEEFIQKYSWRAFEILESIVGTDVPLKEDQIMTRIGQKKVRFTIDNYCLDAVITVGYLKWVSSPDGYIITESGLAYCQKISQLLEHPLADAELGDLSKGRKGALALKLLRYFRENSAFCATGVRERHIIDAISEMTPQLIGNIVGHLRNFGLVVSSRDSLGVRTLSLTARGQRAMEQLFSGE